MADRRALVITAPGIMSMQSAAELTPGPGEVVARPVHTGICGTTARENFTPADLAAQPHAGDIFACTPGVTGRPPYLFGA